MPIDFRYWPPAPEDITGEEVLEQTEAAFNDLAEVIDVDISNAINTANEAKEAAENAVNIANSASTKADEAANLASAASEKVDSYQALIDTANQNANTAIATANEASDVAQNALDTARQADAKATTASDNAAAAITASNSAMESAASAVATADNALSIASQSLWYYDVFSDAFEGLDFDANDFFEAPARYYVDVDATNIPAGASVPFRIDINLSSDNLSVLQTIQSNTGDVTWKRSATVTPATDEDPVTAVWTPWVRYTTEDTSVTKGKIDTLPFRQDELPPGWYFCNGDQYALTSPQGSALNAFSDNFKSDWGITITDENISLPNLFHSDGRGFFVRAADGTTQAIGLGGAQDDAIRNITGPVGEVLFPPDDSTGTLPVYTTNVYSPRIWTTSGSYSGYVVLDASRAVPTAEENRPLNIGMTPAIYLGV